MKEEAELKSTPQPTNLDSQLWKGMWSLNVPNKVKKLMWCACRNAMLTKASLVRRTIIEDPLCDRCHEAPETPLHALWLCKEIDTVWDDSALWSCRRQIQFLSFK